MSNTDKLREIAKRYGGSIVVGYGQPSGSGSQLVVTAEEQLFSDLTALISEKQAEYFEFAKWIGFESSRLYYRDLDEKWIRTIFIIDENPHEEYEEYTTDELFNYWEENEQ